MIYTIHSNLDGKLMQFAQEIERDTEEEACAKGLVIMGMMYASSVKKNEHNTWKDILHQNGLHVRKR